MAKDNKKDKPFHVICQLDGKASFMNGFDKKEWAESDANERNARAEEMGLKTRYIMKENVL